MKDFLDYMINNLHLTPNPNIVSLILCTIINSSLRFGALYGVIYVGIKSVQMAIGN